MGMKDAHTVIEHNIKCSTDHMRFLSQLNFYMGRDGCSCVHMRTWAWCLYQRQKNINRRVRYLVDGSLFPKEMSRVICAFTL